MKLLLGAFLLLISYAAVAASAFNPNANVGIQLDDNITRAELDSDIEKDTIVTVDGSLSHFMEVNDISYVSFGGSLAFNKYLDFDKLDNTRIGVSAGYHIKPVASFSGTQYFVKFDYKKRMYDSAQREGDATRFSIGLSKRFTELLALNAGYIDEEIDSDHRVFDADNKKFYVDVEYLITHNNTLYVTLSYFDGEVVATTVPTSKIIGASTAIVRDDAFLNLAPNRFAYKLDATTTAIKIGDVFSIDRYQGIDASLFYYDSSAYAGNDYKGMILSLFYSYQF